VRSCRSNIQGQTGDELIHVDLACDILRALFSKEIGSKCNSAVSLSWLNRDIEDNRKVLCQVLGKLYLPETVDDDKIRTVKLLVHNLLQVGSFRLLFFSAEYLHCSNSAVH
jgi:condensin complex subunit 3